MRFDDTDIVYRFVPVANVQLNEFRPSSMDIRNSSDGSGMSVAVASLLRADSRGVSSVAPNTVDFAVFAWRVGALRERGFDVIHAPVEGEPAHANVVKVDEGDEPEKPWSRGARRALIEAGSWAIAPSHAETEGPN